MPDRPRAIVHLDMDAFFAAVEQRDNPPWRELPLVVGAEPVRPDLSACAPCADPDLSVEGAAWWQDALWLGLRAPLVDVGYGTPREVEAAHDRLLGAAAVIALGLAFLLVSLLLQAWLTGTKGCLRSVETR